MTRLALFICLVMACGPTGAARLENAAKDNRYREELRACVNDAYSRDAGIDESVKCRCEVNKRWNRECTPELTRSMIPDGGIK